jgi:SAM-dependent methyltransferase
MSTAGNTPMRNVDRFNNDVAETGSYAYTERGRYSSRVANKRINDAITALVDLRGKTLLDVGCGDGTYTFELAACGASDVLGIDAADVAVQRARAESQRRNDTGIEFRTLDIYDLIRLESTYDVAIVRGVLHHLCDPERAISELSKVAHEIIIVEPNGYNPVLKLIERLSSYHREHEEKSYPPHRLDRWFRQCGGRVVHSIYAGLVPFFCPAPLAWLLKLIEPLVELVPVARQLGCAVYVQRVETGVLAGGRQPCDLAPR